MKQEQPGWVHLYTRKVAVDTALENLFTTEHAGDRSLQRNVYGDEIEFILAHGHSFHNAGVTFVQLRAKNIPADLPGNHPFRHLEGTTVMLCACGHTVITLYRQETAFRKDKRKSKHNCRQRVFDCPCCGQSKAA
jgi:hypothetical protein